MAFKHYDVVSVILKPTTREKIDALSNNDRNRLVAMFRKSNIGPEAAASRLLIDEDVVKHLFGKLHAIENRCGQYTRGEVVIEEEVRDTDPQSPTFGEIITPAVYNTSPNNSNHLRQFIADEFEDDFNTGHLNSVISAMINDSKHDGSGNWTFYKANVN